MNEYIFIGNVTRDPEVRDTKIGKVTDFVIAVDTSKTKTEFVRVSAFKDLGVNAAKYLAKGRKCAVIGAPTSESYINKNGESVSYIKVFAKSIEYLTPKSEQQKVVAETEPMPNYDQPMTEDEDDDEDELF